MEMQSKFARDMMAQKLMSENRDNPFNSRFFQPSDAMAAPTRQGFSNLLSKMEQRDKQGTDVFPALAIGSGFAPSAGISDVLGFAPDPFNPGQTLPSFSENIDQGKYLDAGLQTLGAGGDVMLAAAPFAPYLFLPAAGMKLTSQLGKALRGGSKATETSKLFASVKKFPALSKSEETLVASSSAPVNEIAGLGRVKIEKIDPNDLEGSKKRFDELKALTSGYKQERAKAKIIRLENGENAIQYMQPPTEVKKLKISELIATQDNVVLGTNKTAGDVMPLVVKKDGKFFIRDGHHRIAQNINSGDKTADVRLIDLDKGGFVGVKATKSTDEIKDNVVELDFQKKKIEAELDKKDIPRDTSSGHAADGVPAQFGPPAHDMNLKVSEEFTPEGFGTFSTNVGNNYENLKFFISSSKGTPEYKEEVDFYRKLFAIKGNPDAEITVYRASPTNDLRPGDLVTPIKSDAKFLVDESKITQDDIIKSERQRRKDSETIDLREEKNLRTMENIMGMLPIKENTPSKLFEYKVKAKDIRWDGNNGLIRWGYFPDKS